MGSDPAFVSLSVSNHKNFPRTSQSASKDKLCSPQFACFTNIKVLSQCGIGRGRGRAVVIVSLNTITAGKFGERSRGEYVVP